MYNSNVNYYHYYSGTYSTSTVQYSSILCLYNCSQYLNWLKAQIQRNNFKTQNKLVIGPNLGRGHGLDTHELLYDELAKDTIHIRYYGVVYTMGVL